MYNPPNPPFFMGSLAPTPVGVLHSLHTAPPRRRGAARFGQNTPLSAFFCGSFSPKTLALTGAPRGEAAYHKTAPTSRVNTQPAFLPFGRAALDLGAVLLRVASVDTPRLPPARMGRAVVWQQLLLGVRAKNSPRMIVGCFLPSACAACRLLGRAAALAAFFAPAARHQDRHAACVARPAPCCYRSRAGGGVSPPPALRCGKVCGGLPLRRSHFYTTPRTRCAVIPFSLLGLNRLCVHLRARGVGTFGGLTARQM